jgi:hypothetical protein
MRASLAVCLFVAACAQAGAPRIGGDDPGGGDDTPPTDAPKGAVVPDACGDDDGDTVCNIVDKCPGHNDAIDTDADTVADGCDKCPGVDDRPDINANQTPDCLEYVSRTIALKNVGGNLWRGWHSTAGGHTSANENTLTGENAGTFYNSYYVFTLAGFTASSIQQVTLQLQLEMYSTADAQETLSIWDVTTASTSVENTGSDINIYNDLGGGTQYATTTAAAAQINTLLSIPLNATAAMHATQKIGQDFTVGVHVDSTPGWVRFGHTGAGATPTTIQLVIKYLP